jgi:hypothetical protein
MAIIADAFQLTLNGHVGTRPFANVFHVELLGVTPPLADEAASQLYAAYAATFGRHQMDNWVYDSCSYVDLRTADGDSGTWAPTSTSNGAGSGAGAPPQVAALVRWAALGGRATRSGRSYIPGIDEGSISDEGVITGGLQDGITDDANDFIAALAADDLGLCIVSVVGESTIGTVRTITGGTCQPVVATQRRRIRS